MDTRNQIEDEEGTATRELYKYNMRAILSDN